MPAISRPWKVIEPAVGGNVPDSMLKIVLLPDPFGPIRPRISPCSTRNETLLTAVKPPKRLISPATSSTAFSHFAAYGELAGSFSTGSRCCSDFGHTT